jgi:hypothetical protein
VLAKQALYHLRHTSNLFCSGNFWRWGSHELFAQLALTHDPLISAFQIARITSVSHQPLAKYIFLKIENKRANLSSLKDFKKRTEKKHE